MKKVNHTPALIPAARVIFVANEPGRPVRMAVTDDGGTEFFDLSLVQVTDLIEGLTKAMRQRLPGGW